jgi:catechol 2,3-dioxygenase-like lactoylglutathione lyase family enzyme
MTPTPSLARASASNHSRSSCRVREPSRRSPRRHRHRRPRSTRGLRPDDSSRKAWFVSQSLTKRAGRNLMLPPCRHEQASRLQLSTLSEWTRAGVPWVRGRRALSREGSSVRARAPSGNRAITTPTELPPMIPVPCAGLLRATAYRVKAIHAERDHPPLAGVPVSDLDVGIDWYTRFFGRPPDSRVGQEFLWESDERAWLFIEPNAARAGTGRITLEVAGLDALLERLAAQRIEHEPIETYSNGVRHVNVPDPDGNASAFAEPPDAASASPRSAGTGASSLMTDPKPRHAQMTRARAHAVRNQSSSYFPRINP